MIPYARYEFYWEDAGGNYYNVVDSGSRVYSDRSTISEKSVQELGLPVVQSAEDEEAMIRASNLSFLALRGLL